VKELIVTQSAQFEIDQAVAWYDAVHPDLGDNLLYQIDLGLRQIAERPEAWSLFAEKYRHYIIARFPYAIIYHELPDFIEVLAFAHHRRKPLYWSVTE
jgi:toxin ParE1/3/4